MNLLFSEKGTERLDAIVQPGLLCAFDFDGTLAPIVAQPEKVHLPYDIRQQLITLSHYAPIAIITGRSIKDINKHIGFTPDFIIGNHGIEGLPDWDRHSGSYELYCRMWEQKLSAAFQNHEVFDPAIRIEDKGYSLSIHYRAARDQHDVAQKLEKLFRQLTPLPRVIPGKSVFNLVPENATDKGCALMKLMATQNFRTAIYVGDDVTDEDVFRLHRPEVLTVRVEQAVDSDAEFFLRQRQDIKHLLDELIVRLRSLRKAHLVSPSWLAE